MTTTESQIELDLLAKLGDLKYAYRPDIRDRAALEANFREKFFSRTNRVLNDSKASRRRRSCSNSISNSCCSTPTTSTCCAPFWRKRRAFRS
ncbi:hypothetical protein HCX48_09055 [Rhodocyclus tenuis]|uniref:Uncharacterized protein n=2 Tax=Rhodocyclus TaxID=1064 RepID=A0A6L5JY64_RHOTE|nr:hypothetical protein [Rhodocyclus gracilis]MQY51520.1 hypothetical protein [Rhodocyclus gracilis]NJA89368.1 hypothetical protein [Rhodocyclus gracilis]